jgi:hypothetical protein
MISSNTRQDMAVLLTFFNPCDTKRILMNFLYTFNWIKRQGVPVYAIELTFDGQKPSIIDSNVIYVSSNSYFFHKEKMYRVLETHIPEIYTKLLFLDADVYYKESNWYDVISTSLDTNECVHAYETLKYLDLTYRDAHKVMKTCMLNPDELYNVEYATGLSWAMQRSFYNTTGFYDHCIVGNSDLISVMHFVGKNLSESTLAVILRLHEDIHNEYITRPKPKSIDYCKLTVYHLYHGSLTNRQYWNRNTIFNSIDSNIHKLITTNKDGVFEWKTKELLDKWNPVMLNYFKARSDDDLSMESIEVAVTLKTKKANNDNFI